MADQRNISGDAVAQAALETLKTWLLPYLARQERLEGMAPRTLPQPKSFVVAADNSSSLPEDQFPRVVVISPGLAGEPGRGPLGYYSAAFGIAAGAFIHGNDRQQTRKHMSAYVAAIRTCLLTEGLTDLEAVLDWTDETYDEVPGSRVRSEAGGEVALVAYVDDVTNFAAKPWPNGPPSDPYAEPPTQPDIQEVDVDVQKED